MLASAGAPIRIVEREAPLSPREAVTIALHIVVTAKQVLDPETPLSALRIEGDRVAAASNVAPVVNGFDEQAVEAALRIKESGDDVQITVISLGKESAQAAIKQVLAMGADEGILLDDDAFEGGDSYTTARVLATAIEKLGDVDAVFCGRQAADWDMGQVGLGIAELLGWPALTIGKSIKVNDGTLVVERVLMDGFETVEAQLPAVATISNELGEPRYPKLQQIMQVKKKQVTVWSAADLGLDDSQLGADARKMTLERLYVPVTAVECEFMEGDTPEEKAQNLAKKLAEAKLI